MVMDEEKAKSVTIINLLAKHEEAVGELYKAYAKRFPQYDTFWSGLVGEEMKHSALIRDLGTRIGDGSVYFNPDRFRSKPIEVSLDFLIDEMNKAKNVSMQYAYSMALQIEEAMIEKKFFEVFEGDSVEVKHTLRSLAQDTEQHIEQIKEAKLKHT